MYMKLQELNEKVLDSFPNPTNLIRASRVKQLLDNNVPRLNIIMNTVMTAYQNNEVAKVKDSLESISKIADQLARELK